MTLVLALAVSPASACFVCDEVVELDEARAECFRNDYASFLEAARHSETKNAEVDLSLCAGDDGSERRGLDRMRDLSSSSETPGTDRLRSIYILDETGIICLKRLLDEHDGTIDPLVRFDLVEQCNS